MSLIERRVSSDPNLRGDTINDYNKMNMMERADSNCLVGQLPRKLDRSCRGKENTLCMNLIRKHNSTKGSFSDHYITGAEIESVDNANKQINFQTECEKLVSNCNKNNIRRSLTPFKNGINLSLSCTSNNFPVPPDRTKVLNRDKLCNMNFDLEQGGCNHVVQQRFGRRIILSKSTDSVNNTNVCANQEVSVLKPRRPRNASSTYSLHHLPDLKQSNIKRHSFPPSNLSGSYGNIPEVMNCNNLNLPDVSVNKINLKNNHKECRNDNTLCSNCSNCSDDGYEDDGYEGDRYEGDSDDEDDILSYTQEQSVNQKIFRYLESIDSIK